MTSSGVARILLRLATAAVLTFLYLPLVIIAIYAFNESRIQAWPPSGFTLHWFGDGRPTGHQALVNSIIVARDRDRRPGPGHRIIGGPALRLLRTGDDLFLPRPADRPAGRRDRDRALRTSFVTFGVEFGL